MSRSASLALHLSVFVIALTLSAAAFARDRWIIVQSTTSTQNSGLYEHLLPKIEKDTGIVARVVAVGTGQAIKNARNCDGDVLLVHDKASEKKFVAAGYGVARHDLMYNDFVIVGPPSDPAGIVGGRNAAAALAKIAETKSLFASRGDNSGTHKKEIALWRAAGVDPSGASGTWYRETGSGMGATLNVGVGMGAYVLTDRATWISFGNKRDFRIAVQGGDALFNQYGVVLVNKEKCPKAKAALGQKVIDWLLSAKGQAAIASYRLNRRQLFFPNAKARAM